MVEFFPSFLFSFGPLKLSFWSGVYLFQYKLKTLTNFNVFAIILQVLINSILLVRPPG